MAEVHGVDTGVLVGTGQNGRVLKSDVEKYIKEQELEVDKYSSELETASAKLEEKEKTAEAVSSLLHALLFLASYVFLDLSEDRRLCQLTVDTCMSIPGPFERD